MRLVFASQVGSWWFNRFQLRQLGAEYHFRDMLLTAGRVLPVHEFEGLVGHARELAFFQRGFMHGAISAIPRPVVDEPRTPADILFWQFPCRTEAEAWKRHAGIVQPTFADGALHVYVGLPWATWIDKARKQTWGESGAYAMRQQICFLSVRISGLRWVLRAIGVPLRVHTVCQHIYWEDMLPAWRKLGITDLWLSHFDDKLASLQCTRFNLHPWALFAVNVEDSNRRIGLSGGKDPSDRSIFASFIGAYGPNYPSDIRLRLNRLSDIPGWVVQFTDQWHFESAVYGNQIRGIVPSRLDTDLIAVERYNRVLSDSVFALCPSGTGPNTLRLWEALAVGAIPVLLGSWPVLPKGGTLANVDWDRIVLRFGRDELMQLPDLLKNIPLEERRNRQRLGMQAYKKVLEQRCF